MVRFPNCSHPIVLGQRKLTVFRPTAMKPQEVTEALQLAKLKDKIWYVVPSCATTGEGLLEGLAWLSNNVKTPPAPPKK
jgi:ADP-ribosylation factor 6